MASVVNNRPDEITIRCHCGEGHRLVFERWRDDNDEYDLLGWNFGVVDEWRTDRGFVGRLRTAWSVLRSGSSCNTDMIGDKEDALRIRIWLDDNLSHTSLTATSTSESITYAFGTSGATNLT